MMNLRKMLIDPFMLLTAVLGVVGVLGMQTARAYNPNHAKNWTPPDYKIYAQQLCDELLANHPELISVTFHGVPPGESEVYTMFAGSFPDRIGNTDDPDDVMVIKTGITILDPRWHRTNDPIRKFLVMTPLRDATGENIGLLVLAYYNPPNMARSEREFFDAGTAIRDELQFRIKSLEVLFEKA